MVVDLFIDIVLEVQNEKVQMDQIPQTDLSVGVLTVLLRALVAPVLS